MIHLAAGDIVAKEKKWEHLLLYSYYCDTQPTVL